MPKKPKKQRQRAIHQRIAKRRLELEMTQAELAKLAGVDKTAVSHWENGLSAPGGARLPRVAAALKLTLDELFEAA